MKKILAIIACAAMGCSVLAGCGSSSSETTTAAETQAAETTVAETTAATGSYDEYVGKQFAATDPWGGEISVTVRSIADGKMEWTYTDVLTDVTVYNDNTTDFADGKSDFTFEGTDSEGKYTFTYSGTIELKDGNVVITLSDGACTSVSESGGGSAYQVGPLSDDAKTITLPVHEATAGAES